MENIADRSPVAKFNLSYFFNARSIPVESKIRAALSGLDFPEGISWASAPSARNARLQPAKELVAMLRVRKMTFSCILSTGLIGFLYFLPEMTC